MFCWWQYNPTVYCVGILNYFAPGKQDVKYLQVYFNRSFYIFHVYVIDAWAGFECKGGYRLVKCRPKAAMDTFLTNVPPVYGISCQVLTYGTNGWLKHASNLVSVWRMFDSKPIHLWTKVWRPSLKGEAKEATKATPLSLSGANHAEMIGASWWSSLKLGKQKTFGRRMMATLKVRFKQQLDQYNKKQNNCYTEILRIVLQYTTLMHVLKNKWANTCHLFERF